MENSNVTPLVPKEKSDKKEILNSLSPREIVSELDRYVIGQKSDSQDSSSIISKKIVEKFNRTRKSAFNDFLGSSRNW